MSKLVTKDSTETSCEATGHPSECTEPAPGTVDGVEPHSVTINNANGDEQSIATYNFTTLHFDNHSHDYTSVEGCHQAESHDLTASGGDFNKSNWSSSISISPANESESEVLVVSNNIATDPTTGDPVNTVGAGINNSLTELSP